MAGKSSALKVVTDEAPMPDAEQPASIRAAASSGSRRDLLVAMRDHIARDLDAGVPARDLASLTRRLLEIAKDIEAIDAAENGDDVGAAAATPDEPFSG